MIALTTTTANTQKPSLWMVSLYAGLATAVIAFVATLVFNTWSPILYIPVFLLIGAGPVLGYQFAVGNRNWKPIVGGIVGFILAPLAFILTPIAVALAPLTFILWSILVGALDSSQSIWKLLLGSIIGSVLGVVVFLTAGSFIGQDPAWFSTGFTLLCAVWGGTCGAVMIAWGKEAEEEYATASPEPAAA